MEAALSTAGLQVIDGGKANAGKDPAPGSPLWAKRMRKRAKELVGELDTGYMELGRILHEISNTAAEGDEKQEPIFKQWGFPSFGAYVEKELDVAVRKAERLRLIWQVLEVELVSLDKATHDRLVRLGATKLRDLVGILDMNNVLAWLKLAETNSHTQLTNLVRKAREEAEIRKLQEQVGQVQQGTAVVKGKKKKEAEALSDGETVVVDVLGGVGIVDADAPDFDGSSTDDVFGASVVPPDTAEALEFEHFALYPAQRLNVKLALKKAAELSGSDKKSHNLDLICTDFLANNDISGKTRDVARAAYMAKIERIFGVKLVVVSPENKEIVYGLETISKILEDKE